MKEIISAYRCGRVQQLPKTAAGSTLIEMMVTVTTFSIMVSLGTPSYTDFIEKRQLSGGADEIAAFMMLARSSAVKHNQPTTVSFSRDSDSNWCLGMTLGSDPCDCTEQTVSEAEYCALKYTDNSGTAVVEPQAISSAIYSGFELAGASTGSGDSALTFDPIRGILTDLTDITSFRLRSKNTRHVLEVNVSAAGAVKTCADGAPLTGYRSCSG